jgi:hypothetical protein
LFGSVDRAQRSPKPIIRSYGSIKGKLPPGIDALDEKRDEDDLEDDAYGELDPKPKKDHLS